MIPGTMSGIFSAPSLRRGLPAPQASPTGTGQIMPAGAAAGPQSPSGNPPQQNSFMPSGAPGGLSPSDMGMGGPMPPMMPDQSPMTMAPATQRAPIMNPNNNFTLDSLKSGSENPQQVTQTPGTPVANTPGINMQSTPGYGNQLRLGANARNSQLLALLAGGGQ